MTIKDNSDTLLILAAGILFVRYTCRNIIIRHILNVNAILYRVPTGFQKSDSLYLQGIFGIC